LKLAVNLHISALKLEQIRRTRRYLPTLVLGCALVATLQAQDTKTTTTTKTSGGEMKSVTYTGCVQTRTETKTFVLNQMAPVSRTTTDVVGTSGTVTTTTSYQLVPAEKIDIQTHVGHKVEVTGMMIPGGDAKVETTTKVERDDAKDSTTKETTSTKNAMPQFRVTSIKNLAESCTP
jgi:hypothetical protein